MIKVVIIGSGNVAQHLFNEFYTNELVVVLQVAGRNPDTLKPFAKKVAVTTDLHQMAEADIYIIAVNDDSIQAVSESISSKNAIVVHTSGSMPMNLLSNHEYFGVFYPLQTLSENREVNLRETPICLEANTSMALQQLEVLATSISNHVYKVDSEQRGKLHLAAVFVNNFTNHLYHIGYRICQENNLDFEMLIPLIRETSQKIDSVSPNEAQTGPARRGDQGTIAAHLDQLDNSDYKAIYSVLSKSIQNIYGKEL
ncbi:Rossmann-like and DUF2520 domain-containing protein [Pareuzebyella sediminis]|uniref:Rossmann-like and DUF2520 domain-containing protein n=1 Tax=Pareuzebyella sediminis TaxID=2607998 RepID=UPI0011EF8C5C|nr:Rossmann-like and DUF2520 domain-containing protein [Pareuzebyella sediminis]